MPKLFMYNFYYHIIYVYFILVQTIFIQI